MIERRIVLALAVPALLLASLAPDAAAQSDNLKRGQALAEEAMNLSRASDFEGAIAQFHAALEVAPELSGARFTLARLYASLSRFEEARSEFAITRMPPRVAARPQP